MIQDNQMKKTKSEYFQVIVRLSACAIMLVMMFFVINKEIVNNHDSESMIPSWAKPATVDTSFLDKMSCNQLEKFIDDTGFGFNQDPNHNALISKAVNLKNHCIIGMQKPDAKIANWLVQCSVYETSDGKVWYRTVNGDFTLDQIIKRGTCL